ncbi:SPASM domain-containing protein, partial [Candidatus Bathyarchaeota archaeon]|nr:SPASM domain-containing protein [Candidatus Bathyarchaeota archaeon]
VEIMDPQFAILTRWDAKHVSYFKKDRTACPALRHRIMVDHRGYYHPCNFYLKKLGNFLKDDIEKIKKKTAKMYERLNKEMNEKVGECPFKDLCSGGCKALYILTGKVCYNCPIPILIEKHGEELKKYTEIPIERIGGGKVV